MTYPTDDTIRNKVVENVRSTLAAVSAGANYRNTIQRVYVADVTPQTAIEFPCAVIAPDSAAHDDARLGLISTRLNLLVHLRSRDLGDEVFARTGVESIHDLIEDARKALLVDHTRGGVALDTHVVTDTVYPAASTVPTYAADLNVSVDFRISRSLTGIDPGTAS